MKLWDIVKTVGSGIISNVVPGGSALLGVVNELLPEDKKLPTDATGDQVSSAISSLPAADQAQVLMKDFDVQLEQIKQSHASLQTMLTADAQSKHTTRPKIAYGSFLVISAATLMAISAWSYAVITGDSTMLDAVEKSWMFIAALLVPFVTLLHAYFGVLTQESKNRLDSAQGHKTSPITGLIGKLLGGKT